MVTIRRPISKSIAICILLCGCTLPPPLDVISLTKTTVDVFLMIQDKPTTTDVILSEITGKECKTLNALKSKNICEDDK